MTLQVLLPKCLADIALLPAVATELIRQSASIQAKLMPAVSRLSIAAGLSPAAKNALANAVIEAVVAQLTAEPRATDTESEVCLAIFHMNHFQTMRSCSRAICCRSWRS